ncbi:MAG: Glycine/sarcosine N-methyltransferase [Firmicutes bacterium ADurb.Bin182]|nr:MAG: Glycine/sarcosine N-methyltransferase [Firmicutes bacterium ADurb.Bin182]
MEYTILAKLYDPFMADVDYDSWAAYIKRFLPGGGRLVIADCACGTGELTVRLAASGHTLIGIDKSAEMLETASQKARARGLKIPFIKQDIRRFELHKKVDAVICTCDGVNYLSSREQVRRFFDAAYNALKPGGLLIFDISSRYKLSAVLGNNTFANDDEAHSYIWQNAYDESNKLLEMSLTFFIKKGELYERSKEVHIQRAHSAAEIENALSSAGFYLSGVYGGFTTEPPDKEAERIQFVAAKPKDHPG